MFSADDMAKDRERWACRMDVERRDMWGAQYARRAWETWAVEKTTATANQLLLVLSLCCTFHSFPLPTSSPKTMQLNSTQQLPFRHPATQSARLHVSTQLLLHCVSVCVCVVLFFCFRIDFVEYRRYVYTWLRMDSSANWLHADSCWQCEAS